MKNSFSIAIALPGAQLLTFEAKRLNLPCNNGSLGIMAGRQPLLATIEAGLITIVDIEDQRHLFATTGGFCEMLNNHVNLLCDSLICESQIDLACPSADEVVFNRDAETMNEKEKRAYVSDLFKQKLLKDRQSGKNKPKMLENQ